MFFIKKQSTISQVTFDGIHPDLFPDFRRDIDKPRLGFKHRIWNRCRGLAQSLAIHSQRSAAASGSADHQPGTNVVLRDPSSGQSEL